jgi:Holliday junction resolvase
MNRYAKGVRWEREVKRRLEKAGWTVFRCAGSKPVDLIAVKERRLPRVIECKVGRKPPADYIKRKQNEYEKLSIIYLVAIKR